MRAPISSRMYKTRYGWHLEEAVRDDFSLEEIQEIIRSGNIVALR